jgi:TonB-dependent starch-binding outer membrane protein SusC
MKKSAQAKKTFSKIGYVLCIHWVLLMLYTPLSFANTEGGNKMNLPSAVASTITGTITDANNEPLIGATVVLEGTNKGTVTDENGAYSLELTDKEATGVLVFSYVGFDKQIVPIGGQKIINISLKEASVLNEVVVVGYGTQKKGDITGAVAQYKNERLDELPVSRLDQALQGKLAGVQIQNTSSEAGAEAKVRVRGLSSINAGASPLVVVDGHPVPDGLSFVNMADVESVEVLKDAASAAIYGSRGASGVIFITTKSGKAEKPKYNVKYSKGIKSAYKLYEFMTTTDYTKMLFDEATLKATDPSITPPTANAIATTAERAAYLIERDIMRGEATNWQSQAIRDANVQNLQMSVSGGSSNLKYFVSAGYQNDQGMMFHSEYERFNIRSKIDAQLNKRVKLSLNINPSYIKRERPSVNYIDFVRFPTYLPVYLDEERAAFVRQNPLYADVKAGDFAQARYFNGRVYSGKMPDGSDWVNTTAVDPFATANNTPKSVMETRTITSDDFRALNSGDLTINLLPGLDFKVLASAYVNYSNGVDFAQRNSNRGGDVNRGVYTNRLFIDLLNENTLNYKKEFKKHSIGLLAGFTAQKTSINDDQTTGLDFPSDKITTLNTALTIDKDNTFNTRNKVGLLSYLGRATYGFDNKYLLSASFRADGSSYFAAGNKWGYFPSVSLGWVASEEKILRGVKWMSNLKFRGSYGATGNNRIVDFAFIDLLFNANYPTGAANGTAATGQVPSRDILSNANITWERTFQYNGGIDFSILKNRVALSFDMYQSKTDQLLLRQAAMSFTGVPQTWNNIGSLQNNGVELEVTTHNIKTKNFKWTTSANISRNRNEVLELGAEAFLLNQGERTEVYMNKVGAPLIQYLGYKTDGVWLSQAAITDAQKTLKSALSNVFVPGGLKLVDVNNDGVIDPSDRTVIGNPYPDFIWGFNNNLKYKGFDLSFMLQGSQGGTLINGDANYNETKRYNRSYNQNRWLSPANLGDGKTPYSTAGFNWMLTDYVVEDASYIALREVLLGYTIPDKFTKKAKLNGVRLYFSAQNLFFKSGSNYRGINPEARFTTGPYNTPLVDGYQRGGFPMNKTFMFGVDLNF